MIPKAELDQWDERLHPLVKAFGVKKVFDVGLEVLQFPPTWMLTENEVATVISAFNEK